MIGERLRDARAALRARGLRNAGRVPFGYASDPLSHQLAVKPEQAAIVKRMFEMAAAGTPPSVIADWFNTKWDGDRRLFDGRQRWSAKSVLRVLRNNVYLGRIGEVEDTHEAIVDDELFAKVDSAIEGRRTRAPSPRSKQEGDLFLLRQLLRCVQCDHLMTTSSSSALPAPPMGPKPARNVPPRYYRCRGKNVCTGSQVAAEEIEKRVLAWLRRPTDDLTAEARKVLTSYSPIWDVLFPESARRLVAQFVWEVRWDGPKNEFTVMLDAIAVAEAHASIVRQEQERANKSKPHRRKRSPIREKGTR